MKNKRTRSLETKDNPYKSGIQTSNQVHKSSLKTVCLSSMTITDLGIRVYVGTSPLHFSEATQGQERDHYLT